VLIFAEVARDQRAPAGSGLPVDAARRIAALVAAQLEEFLSRTGEASRPGSNR